jgi:hypothetical protein
VLVTGNSPVQSLSQLADVIESDILIHGLQSAARVVAKKILVADARECENHPPALCQARTERCSELWATILRYVLVDVAEHDGIERPVLDLRQLRNVTDAK